MKNKIDCNSYNLILQFGFIFLKKLQTRYILILLKNYVVLNYCHTALDAVFPEIKRDTASSAV
ncbi:MAG: hypothetical protein FWC41_04895, partial [Firmicutes bacterium]|nr:hypothetical protein [Bacillota bacterium]